MTDVTTTVDELRALVRPMFSSEEDLLALGVPPSEAKNFAKYQLAPIALLVKAVWNYKDGDEATAKKLSNSSKTFGQIVNLQVRELETGYFEVVDGNHRLDDYLETGRSYAVVMNHGRISLAEAKMAAIVTNETRFPIIEEKLSEMLQDISEQFSIDDMREMIPFDSRELEQMLTDAGITTESNVDIVEDECLEEPPKHPLSCLGDLYELGDHRLLCGDSTSEDDVATLMAGELASLVHTDPPYNVNYNEYNSAREGGKDWGSETGTEWTDSMSDEDYRSFLEKFLALAKKYSREMAHFYIWYASLYHAELCATLMALEFRFDKVPIIWVKNRAPISWRRYKCKYEPCIYAGKGAVNGAGEGARWFGPDNETNVWDIALESSSTYIHPTQKPVALAARAMRNSSAPHETVLDLFGGSGSTLMAAEQLQRRARLMEMEPAFVDGIVRRYMRYCDENNIARRVLRNGVPITLSDFDLHYASQEQR